MITLDIAANIAEVIGALTIIGGMLFGYIQLREYRKQNLGMVAGELIRTFYSPDFALSTNLVRRLPDGASAEEIRSMNPKYEEAATILCFTFETMGLLMYRRIAPYHLVMEMTGGIIVVMWRKLHVLVETIREEQSQPNFAEWFQWLAEQSGISEINSEPSYLKYKNWKP